MVEERIELLAISRSLDDLCADNDIEPRVVIEWLVENDYLDLRDYFEYEEDELDE